MKNLYRLNFGVFMKKILIKLFVSVLAVCLLLTSLTACGGGAWSGTSMKNWGENNVVGSFIGEKGGYVYYINGIAANTLDNTFGVPVKGSLMAMDKNDFTNTEIVVPKLFVAKDFNAGLYIYGDYVYYGTPNTDMATDGTVANSELVFMKTKLDGTGSEKLFVLTEIGAEYRIIESDGVVYIVYRDVKDGQLEVFNTSTKTTEVIAKGGEDVEGYESLDDFHFTPNGESVTIVYSVIVYSEKYFENKTERAKESYNAVYAYKLGDVTDGGKTPAGTKILDGETENATYALSFEEAGKLFFTETINGNVKTYYRDLDDMTVGAKVKVVNSDVVTEANLIVEESDKLAVYTISGGAIIKTVLDESYKTQAKKIALTDKAKTLIEINGDYMYFYDSTSGISRIKITGEELSDKVEKVSYDTVNSTWYAPEIMTFGEDTYMFYLDNSNIGASYVRYVKLNANAIGEDTDDDGKEDTYKLEGHKYIGKITDADQASIVDVVITEISNTFENGKLVFDKDKDGNVIFADGKLSVKAVKDARAFYEEQTNAVKALISTSSIDTLKKYEKAIEKASLYYKLEGIRSDLIDVNEFKTIYDQVKADIQAFRASSDYASVSAVINNNILWNYEKALDLFETEKK